MPPTVQLLRLEIAHLPTRSGVHKAKYAQPVAHDEYVLVLELVLCLTTSELSSLTCSHGCFTKVG